MGMLTVGWGGEVGGVEAFMEGEGDGGADAFIVGEGEGEAEAFLVGEAEGEAEGEVVGLLEGEGDGDVVGAVMRWKLVWVILPSYQVPLQVRFAWVEW